MKKEKRGSSYEFVGTVRDVDISVVVWRDTKVVTLASSFVGKLPVSSVERYDKKQKKKVSVDSPAIIHEYNKHMGGVDLLDSLIGRHKIGIRSKKWYLRIFYHLIDLTIVNAWILYKRVIKSKVEKGKTKEKILNLWEFRINISECLCKHGTFKNKRGRPSNEIDNSLEVKKKKASSSHIPPIDIRKDEIGHFQSYKEKRGRCKMPKCGKLTYIICVKCGVYLCSNKNNNCFQKFHGV